MNMNPMLFSRPSAIALACLLSLATPTVSALAQVVQSPSGTYWLHQDGKRYLFPGDDTLQSWNLSAFTAEPASDHAITLHPFGGIVFMRPGAQPVRVASLDSWFAVGKGGVLREIASEATVKELYPNADKDTAPTIDIAQYANYKIGAPITTSKDFAPTMESTGAESPDYGLRAVATPSAQPEKIFEGIVSHERLVDQHGNLYLVAKVLKANSPIVSISTSFVPDTNVPVKECFGGEVCTYTVLAGHRSSHPRIRVKAVNELNEIHYSDWIEVK